MYKATKEFRFEMAHVLTNYDGPCGNLHGHSYRCLVTLESEELNDGMVMDFSKIKAKLNKEIFDKMDHAFAFNTKSRDYFEVSIYEACLNNKKKVICFPFRTTAENMAKYIYEVVNKFFKCSKVQLYETTTGCAEYGK